MLDDESGTVRQACEAYAAITYRTHQPMESSVVYSGVMAVTPDIMQRAENVNGQKIALKMLCAPLRRVMVRIPTKDPKIATRPVSARRAILRNIQRSDLNLLAAYRCAGSNLRARTVMRIGDTILSTD